MHSKTYLEKRSIINIPVKSEKVNRPDYYREDIDAMNTVRTRCVHDDPYSSEDKKDQDGKVIRFFFKTHSDRNTP